MLEKILFPLVLITALLALRCAEEDAGFSRSNPFDSGGNNWSPPVVTAMADSSVSINDTLIVTATAQDNGEVTRYVWAINGNSYTDTTAAGALKVAFADSGRYAVHMKVIDDDGVESKPDSCVIGVTLDPPEVMAMRDTVVSFSTISSVTVSVNATDANLGGVIEMYYWDTGADGWDDSTITPSYTITSSAGGVEMVRWAARDDDGVMTCDTFTVMFNRPPTTVTLTAPISSDTSDSWTAFDGGTGKGSLPVTLSAADPDGTDDTLNYTLSIGQTSDDLTEVYSGKAPLCTLSGVDSSSTVYYRLVAHDLFGDSAVSSGNFVVAPPFGVYDFEGNYYPAVAIGNQKWTTVNLRSTKYNDGTDIPHVMDGSAWSNMSTPGYCFYGNSTDAAYQEKWGLLYNWYAVCTGKLAPDGWRVPTDADWTALEEYLVANGYNWDGSSSGNKIGKSLAAQSDWSSSGTAGEVGNDLAGNNRTGFSALPGGYRNYDGLFYFQSYNGSWWSATESSASHAYYRNLAYYTTALGSYGYDKKYGFSVRLVRDLN